MHSHNHITLSLDFGMYQLGTENFVIIKTISPTWSILSTETIFVPLYCLSSCCFVVHSPSHDWLYTTPWTAAHQASLSFTISQSSIKFMSLESVMPSNHLILCHPLILLSSIFPSIRAFSRVSCSQFTSSGQSVGASAPWWEGVNSFFPALFQDT